MNKIQSATIVATLAAGSIDTPYSYLVSVTQRLCSPTCAETTPVFAPQYSLVSTSNVGTNLYSVKLNVQGIISYIPCGGSCCCAKTQPINQNFTILIESATAPTVTVAQGTTQNTMSVTACRPCSRTFKSDTPLTITVA